MPRGSSPLAPRRPSPERQRLVQYFFFAAFLLLLYQTSRMLAVFYLPLLGAALLAMTVYPLHRRVRYAVGRPAEAAALTTLAVVLTVVLPLFGIGWVFFREASGLAPTVRAWLSGHVGWQPGALGRELPPAAAQWLERGRGWLEALSVKPGEILVDNLEALAANAADLAGALLGNVLIVGLELAALAFSLFVFLRDGPVMRRQLLQLVPLSHEHKEQIIERVLETAFAVVRGVLGVALIQGVLAGVGLAIFRVPFPVVLGALTALAAPVPFFGIGLVLGPVVIGLLVSGATIQAFKVLLWTVFVVGAIDNVLRPIWISSGAKLPLWLMFFAVLGGLRLYGFGGLLIGPVLVAVALAFANIYRREYGAELEKAWDERVRSSDAKAAQPAP